MFNLNDFFWNSKVLLCSWLEVYFFIFLMVIFTMLFQCGSTLCKSTLKMTTLFRRCRTLFKSTLKVCSEAIPYFSTFYSLIKRFKISVFQDLGSWVLGSGSWAPGYWGHKSWSRVPGPAFRFLESQVLGPGSWVLTLDYAKFHCLVAFTSWDIGQYLYCILQYVYWTKCVC